MSSYSYSPVSKWQQAGGQPVSFDMESSSNSSGHQQAQPPLHRIQSATKCMCSSLSRLSSSRRLSTTCSGSDLGQLYLSGPEADTNDVILTSARSLESCRSNKSLDSWGNTPIESIETVESDIDRAKSWIDAVDLYGKRKSFTHRRASYARFLAVDVIEDEDTTFLIEEKDDYIENQYWWKSPSVLVPCLMLLDLALGISLSLYDSNLLRNVSGFRFPLCYAWTQKFTNAIASLVLIFLSRRWEMTERERMRYPDIDGDEPLTEMPSIQVFRRNAIPLTAIAFVQTISSSIANRSLQMIPLQLFKVVLMCSPIFVAFLTSAIEGKMYSKGRIIALSLIGIGALRAVYAEAGGADNPRAVMEGAAYGLGAGALSGMGLILSGGLMNGDPADSEKKEDELNPLSLLFYLSCEQVAMLSFYLCPWDELWRINNLLNVSDASDNEFLAFMSYFTQNPQDTIFCLMTGSTIALCLAVLTFTLITRTSPLAASLLANVRSIATVVISSLIWGGVSDKGAQSSIFGSAVLGYTLTLAGGVLYALSPANGPTEDTRNK